MSVPLLQKQISLLSNQTQFKTKQNYQHHCPPKPSPTLNKMTQMPPPSSPRSIELWLFQLFHHIPNRFALIVRTHLQICYNSSRRDGEGEWGVEKVRCLIIKKRQLITYFEQSAYQQLLLSWLYIIKMNHCFFPWSKTTKEFQDTLTALPLLASVPIHKIQRSFSQNDLFHQPKLQKQLELQLRSNYFIIINRSEEIVLDAFEAEPSVFILIKQLTQQTNTVTAKEYKQNQGMPSMIKFGDRTAQNCFIALYCQTGQQNLIELYRTFPKTYTIQLDFHQQFKPIRRIGQGLTSTVYQAVRLIDKTSVAVKAFKKSHYFAVSAGKGQKAFLKEFKMLTQCCHQNLCHFGGVYQTENTIYIVQELYEKSLSSLLCLPGEIKREEVVNMMEELLNGIAYLHSKGIMHRDLKPENIMFRKQIKLNTYKPVIIDLGLAEYTDTQDYLFQKCGTPGYVAPEVFTRGAKTAKCDIFSLGVIFYNLLFKLPVFVGVRKEEVLMKNRQGKMDLNMQKLQELDQLVRDLLLKMLTVDQQKRISADMALQHPLFTNRKVPETPKTKVSLQDVNDIKNQMKFYGIREIEQ